MFYEEFINEQWHRIIIDGEMLSGGIAHHVIYFPREFQWREFPEWIHGRSEEIIGRIKQDFQPPEYEYEEARQAGSPNGR